MCIKLNYKGANMNAIIMQSYNSSHFSYLQKMMKIEQKGMHLNHDFYVVLGKQCRTVHGSPIQYLYID